MEKFSQDTYKNIHRGLVVELMESTHNWLLEKKDEYIIKPKTYNPQNQNRRAKKTNNKSKHTLANLTCLFLHVGIERRQNNLVLWSL